MINFKALKKQGVIVTQMKVDGKMYGKIKRIKPAFKLPSKHAVHEFYEIDDLFEEK